jgi:hypothetical protein
MLNLISLKKKEVPEELQRTEKIFDTKLKQLEVFSDPNKFLLAEKNGIPYYTYITSNNLLNSNNNYICFIDLDENSKLASTCLEISEQNDDKNTFSTLAKIVTDSPPWRKFKEFFKFESSILNDINNPDEIAKSDLLKTKEIKIMKTNGIGNIIALINKNNSLMLTNIETKSKILKLFILFF